MKILKAVWFVFESICFGIGLFILIVALTAVVSGGSISISKDEKPVFCYSLDNNQCINTLSEETKHEQN